MTTALVITALFFVIGIGVGVVTVIAVSILRRDVGPAGGPGDPPGYGPSGPHGPSPDLEWDDEEPAGDEENARWRSYGRS